jgi:hypothetical protein
MSQEQAANPFYDFMYGKYLIQDYFDLQMHEDDYVERAYNIFRDIGNIATAIHAFEFEIGNSCVVDLPCNVEFIEAVSTGQEWRDDCGDNIILFHADHMNTPNNNFFADAISNPSASRVNLSTQTSNLHPKGEFIPYELQGSAGGRRLSFTQDCIGTKGVVIYRGICVDHDGNPLLARKEAEAIAYKLQFMDVQKKSFMGDPNAKSMLEYIKTESGRKMAAAKIPEYITQNHLNRMLSAMTRHDRKVFDSSYKSMQ